LSNKPLNDPYPQQSASKPGHPKEEKPTAKPKKSNETLNVVEKSNKINENNLKKSNKYMK